MSEHFNKLTPAEAERLALLSEELGEAQQAIGKILRHGYESYNPTQRDGPDNRESLERELGDVRHAMIRLCDAGDLRKDYIHKRADLKAIHVQQYLHHQENTPITPTAQGVVTDAQIEAACDAWQPLWREVDADGRREYCEQMRAALQAALESI